MGGGYKKIHEHENVNTQGFDKHPKNINKLGKPISIKNEIKEILTSKGSIIIPKDDIIETLEDGSIKVNMPTVNAIALKLTQWAMSKKGNDSIKAIQMIWEHIEGKPMQRTEQKINLNTGLKISVDNIEEAEEITNMLDEIK